MLFVLLLYCSASAEKSSRLAASWAGGRLLRKGDGDGDGSLTLDEFIDCFDDLKGEVESSPEERLASLFHSLDDDGTGWVDSRELFEGLKALGISATYEEIQEILAGGDVDGDGRLTLEEFLDCFEQVNLEELFDGADLEAVERAAKSDDEHRAIVQAEAMQMFYDIDADQSGYITAQEVRPPVGDDAAAAAAAAGGDDEDGE